MFDKRNPSRLFWALRLALTLLLSVFLASWVSPALGNSLPRMLFGIVVGMILYVSFVGVFPRGTR
jgi:hypothetical protein